MIQRFKRKTTWILIVILWSLLFGILIAVNILNVQSNLLQTKRLLIQQVNIIRESEKKKIMPPIVNGEELSRIYTVAKDEEGEFTVVFCPESQLDQKEELVQLAKQILTTNKMEGVFNHVRYAISLVDQQTYISFLDYTIWHQQQFRMILSSIMIGMIGAILLSVVAVRLTRWLTKPVIEAFEKQKQFISDAGHELKTPLTVIKSSLDLLESQVGDSKYIEYIRNENDRMTELTYDLLYLSNMDGNNKQNSFERVDLSRCVEGTSLPFEALVYEQGFRLELNIEEGIIIEGDEKQLRKMVEVFLDNAMKHTYPKGKIQVGLTKEKGKSILKVSNEGEPIPEEEQHKIFDRFYRSDKSRERSAGRYGLGLAIARKIAEGHKGSISVTCKDHSTTFSVVFPLAG